MEFEVLKRSHLKRNVIIGVAVVLIITACVLTFTRAKYRTTESMPLINGTVNYDLADLNMVAVYIEDESASDGYAKVDTIPTEGYAFNEEMSYCTVDGNRDDGISLSYDMDTQTLNVAPLTIKGTKCYLYFKLTTKIVDTVLGKLEINLDTPDFSKSAQATCTNTDYCEETNGIYETVDDYGTVYYWRGAVDDNWVYFAGYYWRIIRFNGDGSIRLIYSGDTEPATTGSGTRIGTGAFNSSSDYSYYVGYMYTAGEQHGNTVDSTVKEMLDDWYENNLLLYANYLADNGFCGDREMASGYTWSAQPTDSIYYAARDRLYSDDSPTLICNNSDDLYTTNNNSRGNGALTYPIGLITADEAWYAGGVDSSVNNSFYLYTGELSWTMTPFVTHTGGGITPRMFYISNTGRITYNLIVSGGGQDFAVRPVINLRADVTISSGDGTASNPYVIA